MNRLFQLQERNSTVRTEVLAGITTFLTMFVGGTGPFVAAFISPDRFGKEETVASHASCMTMQHGLKVIVFGLFGFAFGPWLPLLASAGLVGLVATLALWLGLFPMIVGFVVFSLVTAFPLEVDTSVWYANSTGLLLAVLAVATAFGVRTATRPAP